VIGVIHRSSRDALIEELKGREDFELIKVTEANRDSLPANLIQKSMVFLGGNRKL
jgi:nucleoside-triphosphatase THEP1